MMVISCIAVPVSIMWLKQIIPGFPIATASPCFFAFAFCLLQVGILQDGVEAGLVVKDPDNKIYTGFLQWKHVKDSNCRFLDLIQESGVVRSKDVNVWAFGVYLLWYGSRSTEQPSLFSKFLDHGILVARKLYFCSNLPGLRPWIPIAPSTTRWWKHAFVRTWTSWQRRDASKTLDKSTSWFCWMTQSMCSMSWMGNTGRSKKLVTCTPKMERV